MKFCPHCGAETHPMESNPNVLYCSGCAAALPLESVQCVLCGGSSPLDQAVYERPDNAPDLGPVCRYCVSALFRIAWHRGWTDIAQDVQTFAAENRPMCPLQTYTRANPAVRTIGGEGSPELHHAVIYHAACGGYHVLPDHETS